MINRNYINIREEINKIATIFFLLLVCACSNNNKDLYGIYESKGVDSLGYSKIVLYAGNYYSVKSNSCLTFTQDTGTFTFNSDTLSLMSLISQTEREKNKTYTQSNYHKLLYKKGNIFYAHPASSRTKTCIIDTINFWVKK